MNKIGVFLLLFSSILFLLPFAADLVVERMVLTKDNRRVVVVGLENFVSLLMFFYLGPIVGDIGVRGLPNIAIALFPKVIVLMASLVLTKRIGAIGVRRAGMCILLKFLGSLAVLYPIFWAISVVD